MYGKFYQFFDRCYHIAWTRRYHSRLGKSISVHSCYVLVVQTLDLETSQLLWRRVGCPAYSVPYLTRVILWPHHTFTLMASEKCRSLIKKWSIWLQVWPSRIVCEIYINNTIISKFMNFLDSYTEMIKLKI
jgi:hypothetical protein